MVNNRKKAFFPEPRLIRAARGLLGLDQATLAKHAKVSRKAVVSLEGDESDSMDYRRIAVLQKLQTVLENKFGVEFQKETSKSGAGVRFKNPGGDSD